MSDSSNGNGPCVNVESVATEKSFCVGKEPSYSSFVLNCPLSTLRALTGPNGHS